MTGRARARSRIGELWIDAITFDETIETIAALVARREGGTVFTPNVDHVVLADSNAGFRAAYRSARLVVVDGTPVLWASRLLGTPLPEKISGSDLVLPLARRAAAEGWRVCLLGAAPGVADEAAVLLLERTGLAIVGVLTPIVAADGRCTDEANLVARLRALDPHLVLVALGTPKQELWIDRVATSLPGTVMIGIGASLDFLTGRVRRAPRWVGRAGLEWLFRLACEPRRLWRRYLVRDPRFALTVARTARIPRAARLDPPPHASPVATAAVGEAV